jgi:hypothetical protein
MVDSKFNNVEKNDGFDFGIFGFKMTAMAGTFGYLRTGGDFLTRVALSVKVRVKGESERNMC